MPWSEITYPVEMENLPEDVRRKAIEIANALLEQNPDMEEEMLIATAISRAKTWAANRDWAMQRMRKKQVAQKKSRQKKQGKNAE